MKLHAKFSILRPYGLGQKAISSFHNINLCKTCDPQNGANIVPMPMAKI